MTEYGEEYSIFVLAEAVVRTSSAGGIGPLEFDGKNHTNGAEAKNVLVLLSVCKMTQLTIGLYVEYTFRTNGGVSLSRYCYR